MNTWALINKDNKEVICNGELFKYDECILKMKEIFPDLTIEDNHDYWCNTFSFGFPRLEAVVVPNGTFEKLGIKYNGEPIRL